MTSLPLTYPVFESNQVLTADKLNELFNYLDQQNRLTRTHLIGVGIVCGLQLDTTPLGQDPFEINISSGCGITTLGYLIHIEDCQLTHYKPYALPDKLHDPLATNDEQTSFYEPFYSVLTNDTQLQYDLWELLNINEFAAEDVAAQGIEVLDRTFASDKSVLLFLESPLINLKNCIADDCDDLGSETRGRIRKLLVKTSDLLEIIKKAEGLPDSNTEDDIRKHLRGDLMLPDVFLPRFDVPASGLATFEQISDRYRAVKERTVSSLATALTELINIFAPIYADPTRPLPTDIRQTLEDQYTGLGISNPAGIQYYFDYLCDLIGGYSEFRDRIFELSVICCPDTNAFPKHLMLGKALVEEDKDPSTLRHYFQHAPIHNEDAGVKDEVRLLFRRIIHLLQRFKVPDPPSGSEVESSIRITPSRHGKHKLSEKAIPYYYPFNAVAPLHKVWDPQKQRARKEDQTLGYDATNYSSIPAVIDPLGFDLEPYDFFRIEGHVGVSIDLILPVLNRIRSSRRLPFNILSLELDTPDWTRFLEKYPGIQHRGGVPEGGTFVILSKKRESAEGSGPSDETPADPVQPDLRNLFVVNLTDQEEIGFTINESLGKFTASRKIEILTIPVGRDLEFRTAVRGKVLLQEVNARKGFTHFLLIVPKLGITGEPSEYEVDVFGGLPSSRSTSLKSHGLIYSFHSVGKAPPDLRITSNKIKGQRAGDISLSPNSAHNQIGSTDLFSFQRIFPGTYVLELSFVDNRVVKDIGQFTLDLTTGTLGDAEIITTVFIGPTEEFYLILSDGRLLKPKRGREAFLRGISTNPTASLFTLGAPSGTEPAVEITPDQFSESLRQVGVSDFQAELVTESFIDFVQTSPGVLTSTTVAQEISPGTVVADFFLPYACGCFEPVCDKPCDGDVEEIQYATEYLGSLLFFFQLFENPNNTGPTAPLFILEFQITNLQVDGVSFATEDNPYVFDPLPFAQLSPAEFDTFDVGGYISEQINKLVKHDIFEVEIETIHGGQNLDGILNVKRYACQDFSMNIRVSTIGGGGVLSRLEYITIPSSGTYKEVITIGQRSSVRGTAYDVVNTTNYNICDGEKPCDLPDEGKVDSVGYVWADSTQFIVGVISNVDYIFRILHYDLDGQIFVNEAGAPKEIVIKREEIEEAQDNNTEVLQLIADKLNLEYPEGLYFEVNPNNRQHLMLSHYAQSSFRVVFQRFLEDRTVIYERHRYSAIPALDNSVMGELDDPLSDRSIIELVQEHDLCAEGVTLSGRSPYARLHAHLASSSSEIISAASNREIVLDFATTSGTPISTRSAEAIWNAIGADRKIEKFNDLPEKVQIQLSEIKDSVKAKYPDARLYLTGSWVRGTWVDDSTDPKLSLLREMVTGKKRNSDLDIWVVGENIDVDPEMVKHSGANALRASLHVSKTKPGKGIEIK